jgi:hypothetical protein
MSQVLRLALLLAFVALALAGSRLPPTGRRLARNALILLALAAGLGAALLQKDLWPFGPWPVLAEDATLSDRLTRLELVAVDGTGREWPVHPDTWAPMTSRRVAEWLHGVRPQLAPDAARRADAFLLDRAEQWRRGRRVGPLLGPLSAPPWLRTPPPAAIGDQPFVALRAYRVSWVAREVLAGARPARVLEQELRP